MPDGGSTSPTWSSTRAHRHAAEGIRVARAANAIDLEMLGRSLQGLALVASGAVAEGMRALDEVNTAVVAGEMSDLIAIGLAGCYIVLYGQGPVEFKYVNPTDDPRNARTSTTR